MKQRYQEMLQKLNKTPPAESDRDKTVKADVRDAGEKLKLQTTGIQWEATKVVRADFYNI